MSMYLNAKFQVSSMTLTSFRQGVILPPPPPPQNKPLKRLGLNPFDKGLQVCGIFFDISNALDKVWDDGLIFKLCQNGISRDITNILRDFLRNRKQRVVLNGQCSSWADVYADVPQGSILGPLLFLIYVNDLSNGLKSECKLFADAWNYNTNRNNMLEISFIKVY